MPYHIALTALQQIEREAHKLAGRVFSLTKVGEIRQILYDELRLDAGWYRDATCCHCIIMSLNSHAICLTGLTGLSIGRTKGGNDISTEESNLVKMAAKHAFPGKIVEFRHCTKILQSLSCM